MSDKIPSVADRIAEIDKMNEYKSTHQDPRKMYAVSYTVCGKQIVENVLAETAAEAKEKTVQQCGMVGWVPQDLTVKDM